MGTGVVIASLVLSAVGTIGSVVSARQAADEQKDIAEQQAAMDKQKRIEERRAEFRRRRIAAARVAQGSENTGTSGSSGEVGALGSLNTQGSATTAGIRTREVASKRIFSSQTQIAELNAQASIFNSVADIGGSLFMAANATPKKPDTRLQPIIPQDTFKIRESKVPR
jgi:hypothetical protein